MLQHVCYNALCKLNDTYVSDTAKKQRCPVCDRQHHKRRLQSSLTLLHVQHQHTIVRDYVPIKNDINFYLRYYVIYVRWRGYVTMRMKTKISFNHTRGTEIFPII